MLPAWLKNLNSHESLHSSGSRVSVCIWHIKRPSNEMQCCEIDGLWSSLISTFLILYCLRTYIVQSPVCAPLIALGLQTWGTFLVLLRLTRELVLICEISSWGRTKWIENDFMDAACWVLLGAGSSTIAGLCSANPISLLCPVSESESHAISRTSFSLGFFQ